MRATKISVLVTFTLLALSFSASVHAAEIHEAARAGDLEKVRSILKSDPSQIRAVDDKGNTPLHLAKNAAVADVLIKASAPFDVKNAKGQNPVDAAAADGRVDVAAAMVDSLAKMMAGVKRLAEAMGTPADDAGELVYNEDLPGLTAMLDKHPDLVKQVTTKQKLPLLTCAVIEHWLPGMELLLKRGADPDQKLDDGSTALHEAAAHSAHEEPVAVLLDHGANIDAKRREDNVTALHIAAIENSRTITRMLLMRGANAGMKTKDGWTALEIAKRMNKDEALYLLQLYEKLGQKRFKAGMELLQAAGKGDVPEIERIASADKSLLTVATSLGYMPIHLAVLNNHPEAVTALIRLGTDPAQKVAGGNETPLELAKTDETRAVLQKQGVFTDADVDTFLTACAHGEMDSVKSHVERFPKIVNAQNRFLGTGLHWAASAGQVEVITYLLQHGANPKLKDDVGATPKDEAKKRKQPAAVKAFK